MLRYEAYFILILLALGCVGSILFAGKEKPDCRKGIHTFDTGGWLLFQVFLYGWMFSVVYRLLERVG